MSQFISSSLLALTAAASVYATPLSTSSHYIPSTGANLAVAPLIEEHYPHGSLNNSYIVVFKSDSPGHLVDNHYNFLQTAQHSHPLDSSFTGGLRHLWDGNVKGYAGTFSDRVVEQIRRMPEVAFVERDQIVRTTKFETQKGAPWGLARISHRKKLTFGTFSKYEYDSDGGEGVNVYVVDTGINIEHEEFEGRAHWGKTIPQNDQDIDGNGHGTHCAGTIASKKYGVAKKANVIAVKVLGTNGSGSMSDVVAGVQWAATDAQKHAEAADAEFAATGKTNHKGSVANMSLGGGKSRALDIAVNAAVDTGLHFAVAAGNDNRDACNYSPAAAEKAITVGASDISDKRAYFSNHGPCVDVFGPGLNILSTYIGSKSAVATLSGTSMASPHVAGLAAYLLSIYGTESFDPKTGKKSMIPSALQVERIASTSVYGAVHRALPGFVTQYMPSPQLVATFTAPIPKRPVLSAEELKTGVLDLSTSGLLTDMPEKTINLLVFNNATSA